MMIVLALVVVAGCAIYTPPPVEENPLFEKEELAYEMEAIEISLPSSPIIPLVTVRLKVVRKELKESSKFSASPKETFEDIRTALAENKPKKAWSCLSRETRKKFQESFGFGWMFGRVKLSKIVSTLKVIKVEHLSPQVCLTTFGGKEAASVLIEGTSGHQEKFLFIKEKLSREEDEVKWRIYFPWPASGYQDKESLTWWSKNLK